MLTDRLNEILADEWSCVRALRRAEAKCDDPGQLEVIKRVRKDCSVNCVNLTHAIRALNGRPTDTPSARFSSQLKDEMLADILDLAQSVQHHLIAELSKVIDEPELQPSRNTLALVLQLHQEDLRWLQAARGT
jgi:Domain of unknown function (DUF6306)